MIDWLVGLTSWKYLTWLLVGSNYMHCIDSKPNSRLYKGFTAAVGLVIFFDSHELLKSHYEALLLGKLVMFIVKILIF